jgi:hypothetical protein
LVIVATEGLLLIHVPPVAGRKDVVAPIQIVAGPLSVVAGLPFTLMGMVPAAVHPEDEVKLIKANPLEIPVTRPEFVILATVGLLLVQTPPDVGETVVVDP